MLAKPSVESVRTELLVHAFGHAAVRIVTAL